MPVHSNRYRPIWRCCQCIISAILARKNRYAILLHGVFGFCLWLINANSLSCSLRCAASRRHQVSASYTITLHNRPNKPLYDATFAHRFLRAKESADAGLPIWLFWNQGLKFWLFLNTFGFFWKSRKARQNLSFSSRKGLVLEKHCLSCIFITNLSWKVSITMQGAQNIEKILLLP